MKTTELGIRSNRWISSDKAPTAGNGTAVRTSLVLENPTYDGTSELPILTAPGYAVPTDSLNQYLNSAQEYEVPSQTNTFDHHASSSNATQNGLPPSYASINGQELNPDNIYTAPLPAPDPSSPAAQPQPSPYSTPVASASQTDDHVYFELQNSFQKPSSFDSPTKDYKNDNSAEDPLYFQLESNNQDNHDNQPTYFELEQPSATGGAQENIYFELENTENQKKSA